MIFIKKYKNSCLILLLIILNLVGLKQLMPSKSVKSLDEISLENEDYRTDNLKNEVKKIKVDIKGAVVRPGVYEMLETDTLNNLILASGGFSDTAYTANLGLSSVLKDGQMIYVYTKEEYQNNNRSKNSNNKSSSVNTDKATNSASNNAKPQTSYSITNKTPDENENSAKGEAEDEKIKTEENKEVEEPLIVNINTASITELVKLNGIGEAKANAIISYRTANGLFKNIEEIMNVKGIGPSIYAKIKEYITI